MAQSAQNVRQNSFTEIFDDAPYTYSRQDAINDGSLIDVSDLAKTAGFRYRVAISRAAWTDCVEWSDADREKQIHQSMDGRLRAVLFMGERMARHGSALVYFQVFRVPRGCYSRQPKLAKLKMVCNIGDEGAPVITIMQCDES